ERLEKLRLGFVHHDFCFAFAEEFRYSLDLHTCEATAHMIRMRVSDKSVSDLNLVLCRNAKDLVDPPRAVHHRNFACLCRADEIDKILHRTHFDLLEVEPAVHFTDGLQNENCKVQKLKSRSRI